MNIRDIEYIEAVVRYRHFGRAAEACNVSQPTLSTQIKKCEDELGIRIFERQNKKVSITPEGERFMQHAQEILNHYQAIKNSININQPFNSEVRLGVFPTLAPYLLPKIIPQLYAKHKELKLFLFESKSEEILEQLQEGKLDCAILASELKTKTFDSVELFFDPFFVALPAKHALSSKKSLSLEEVENELLLLEEGHCLREQTLEVCNSLLSDKSRQFNATSLETLRYMVSGGIGITLIPASAAVATKNLVYVPLKEKKIGRKIYFIYKKDSYKNQALEHIKVALVKLTSNF